MKNKNNINHLESHINDLKKKYPYEYSIEYLYNELFKGFKMDLEVMENNLNSPEDQINHLNNLFDYMVEEITNDLKKTNRTIIKNIRNSFKKEEEEESEFTPMDQMDVEMYHEKRIQEDPDYLKKLYRQEKINSLFK